MTIDEITCCSRPVWAVNGNGAILRIMVAVQIRFSLIKKSPASINGDKDGDKNMFMTANRIKREGKPLLKLNIHEYDEGDIPFLDSLGIDQREDDSATCRYILIHSQEDFFRTRSAILQRYTVLEEKGPKVFLEAK